MEVFAAFYFGPIDYFSALVKSDDLWLEKHENFQKQTFRSRCFILGANGPLMLAIPTVHNGKRLFKDIQPSYEFDWQKEQLKSLISAYKSSPYFEFYEDEITPLFEKKEKFLLDLNLKTIDFINQKLKLDLDLNYTDKYQSLGESEDLRSSFNAKQYQTAIKPYYQVFGDKFDFQPNLSILDLLFNEGPSSATYLKQLEI